MLQIFTAQKSDNNKKSNFASSSHDTDNYWERALEAIDTAHPSNMTKTSALMYNTQSQSSSDLFANT